MNLVLGKEIAVSTSYIKSHPAMPIYKGKEDIENLYSVIYHIEIGCYEDLKLKCIDYIIIDFKSYDLSEDEKKELVNIANQYCSIKKISEENIKFILLDNEEAESFVEKLFDNMKIIRGLTKKRV